jgi:hypothetical protein
LIAFAGFLAPVVFILYRVELFLNTDQGEGDEPRSYRARYAEIFNRDIDAPILILGSSNSAHGVAPSKLKLGKAVFNFSFNGADCKFNLLLYREYLRKYYRKPECIIYALSPVSFTHQWRRIEDDRIYVSTKKHSLIFLLFHPDGLKIFNAGTLAEEIVKGYAREKATGNHVGMDMRKYDNGFLPFSYGTKFSLIKNHLEYNMDEISSLSELLAEIRKDGIQVILITLPYPKGNYPPEEVRKFNDIVDGMGAANDSVVIKAEAIVPEFGEDYSLFNDEVHLTESGAYLYSEKLSAALRNVIK